MSAPQIRAGEVDNLVGKRQEALIVCRDDNDQRAIVTRRVLEYPQSPINCPLNRFFFRKADGSDCREVWLGMPL